MVPNPSEEKPTLKFSDNTTAISDSLEQTYSTQNLSKRRNSESDIKDDIVEHFYKRGRPTTDNSTCFLADFGCQTNKPFDDLQTHYASQTHQECLMKAVEFYVQQSHNQLKINSVSLNQDDSYSEVVESLNTLAEGVACLHDDNIQNHDNVVQIQSTIMEQNKQIQQLKSSIDETSQYIQAAQFNNTILQTEMESIKQMTMNIMSQSSNDGTFIWKVTNIAQKLRDAIAEQQTSVYSPPFYSSPTGYKMCMRLYLNGDGQARRTHLSLFFVLMRGDYDGILEWPFNYKITFCLFDQTGNKRHIIDSFRPDSRSNSFQRPRSDMNIASGVPKFCPLTIIQQDNNPYVRDDCMFIRCIVDFASTPKSVIPFICSVNPGLPKSIQQTMIQAEIERQKLETLSKPSDEQTLSPENRELR